MHNVDIEHEMDLKHDFVLRSRRALGASRRRKQHAVHHVKKMELHARDSLTRLLDHHPAPDCVVEK